MAGVLRRCAALLLAGGVVLGLGACRADTAHRPAAATPSVPPASHAPASSTPASHGIPKSAFAGLESFTGPAVTKFGRANVQAAYEEMVNFAFATGWDPALISTTADRLSLSDFANARSYMTPTFRKAFDQTLAKVVRADNAATQKLEHAMLFGITARNGGKPITGSHVVTDRKFSKASIAVDKSQHSARLSMTFRAEAHVQMVDKQDQRYGLPTRRTVQYWLVPNTGADKAARPFRIDSWAIRLATGSPTGATGQ